MRLVKTAKTAKTKTVSSRMSVRLSIFHVSIYYLLCLMSSDLTIFAGYQCPSSTILTVYSLPRLPRPTPRTLSPADLEQHARDLVALTRTLPEHHKPTTLLNNVVLGRVALVQHAHSSIPKVASFRRHSIVDCQPLHLWLVFRRLRQGPWLALANIGA